MDHEGFLYKTMFYIKKNTKNTTGDTQVWEYQREQAAHTRVWGPQQQKLCLL